ncbi:hypothetical protein FHJ30_17010 [Arthrobacter sp. BB-1]|nr:hypothetical protein FHJ30_17010 [Arthrobacter sp. BB-1]
MDPMFVFDGSIMSAGRGRSTIWLLEDTVFNGVPAPGRVGVCTLRAVLCPTPKMSDPLVMMALWGKRRW